jgi:phosphate transport system substrate-binding protein
LKLTADEYDANRKLVLGGPAPKWVGPGLADPSARPTPIDVLAARIDHAGTSQSFAQLADRKVDLILVAREPTAIERDQVRRSGTTIVVERIARDAFVFLRNAKNPVTNLPLDRIRDIYAGAIKNWKELGGNDQPIMAYQRDASSGSQVEMEQIMGGRPMLSGLDIRMTAAMFGPFNAVRHDVAGIGYSYHYYERYMAVIPEVATLAVDGVAADPASIESGKYPLVTYVYLAHRSDLTRTSAAARLRDWLRTPAGQAVVAESGYVPIAR